MSDSDLMRFIQQLRMDIDSLLTTETVITGWQKDNAVWVYVSTTSFKVVGVDVTLRFPVGSKLRCKQGAGYLYFYVVSAAFSSDTTVTVTGGSDYSLANATITDNYYSYVANPQGFPQWFNWTPSLNTGSCVLSGFSGARFSVNGRTCQFVFKADNKSMSGSAGSVKIGLPINLGASSIGAIVTHQLRAVYFISAYIDVRTDLDTAAPSVFALYKDITNANWLASETGVFIRVSGFYEI
jgi:hypothetical protein